jgi:hypothetical protein
VLVELGQKGFVSYIGPSIGAVCGTIADVLFLILCLRTKLNLPFAAILRWKELCRIFGLSLFCGAIMWCIPLPIENLLVKLSVQFIAFTLLYVSVAWATKSLKPDEIELINIPLRVIKRNVLK